MSEISELRTEEQLICTIADMIAGERHVAVGAASPIPGAAALLARLESRKRMDITILHSRKSMRFTEGTRELFDCTARGHVDVFFLGGVQIDGTANINLIGTGNYPQMDKRFSGSFGSALMYYMAKKVILFREEHSPRTLVKKVDFISAPGVSSPQLTRPGGPHALLTNRALFSFNKETSRFCLQSFHQGETPENIIAQTGFEFDMAETLRQTPSPSLQRLILLREQVAPELAEFYPEFAYKVFPALAC